MFLQGLYSHASFFHSSFFKTFNRNWKEKKSRFMGTCETVWMSSSPFITSLVIFSAAIIFITEHTGLAVIICLVPRGWKSEEVSITPPGKAWKRCIQTGLHSVWIKTRWYTLWVVWAPRVLSLWCWKPWQKNELPLLWLKALKKKRNWTRRIVHNKA